MCAALWRGFPLAVTVAMGLALAGVALALADTLEDRPSGRQGASYAAVDERLSAQAGAPVMNPGPGCPDNSPHGRGRQGPSDCSVCHTSPPADGSVNLVAPDVYSLCIGCHDGSGAETDVLRGRSTRTGARLNGGGFLFVPDSSGVLRPVTSRHETAGLPLDAGGASDGSGTAWGSLGPEGIGPGIGGVLTCTSCHDPHGSGNYRLLRGPGDDGGGWLTGEPAAGGRQSFQVLPTAGEGNADDCNYGAGDRANYTAGMRDYCASCHSEYLTPGEGAGDYQPSGPYDAGDGRGIEPRFRHAQVVEYGGVLARPMRLAAPAVLGDEDGDGYWDPGEAWVQDPEEGARTAVVCTTCHFAHGTAATATGYAADVPPTNDSALLYYDGRGVCLACHQYGK